MSAEHRRRGQPSPKLARKRDGHVRERILEAARAVFSARGYNAAYITDIIKAADCGTGSFYQYFPSKDDVFLAVITSAVDEMKTDTTASRPGFPEPADPVERLLERNRRYYETYARHGPLISALEEAVVQNPVFRDLRLKIREDYISSIGKQIVRLQRSDDCKWPGDPAALAGVLGSMIERTAYMQAIVGEPFHDYAAAATWVWCQALGIGGTTPG